MNRYRLSPRPSSSAPRGVGWVEQIGGFHRLHHLVPLLLHSSHVLASVVVILFRFYQRDAALLLEEVNNYLAIYSGLVVLAFATHVLLASPFYAWAWNYPEPQELSKRRCTFGCIVDFLLGCLPTFILETKIVYAIQFHSTSLGVTYCLSCISFFYTGLRVWLYVVQHMAKIRFLYEENRSHPPYRPEDIRDAASLSLAFRLYNTPRGPTGDSVVPLKEARVRKPEHKGKGKGQEREDSSSTDSSFSSYSSSSSASSIGTEPFSQSEEASSERKKRSPASSFRAFPSSPPHHEQRSRRSSVPTTPTEMKRSPLWDSLAVGRASFSPLNPQEEVQRPRRRSTFSERETISEKRREDRRRTEEKDMSRTATPRESGAVRAAFYFLATRAKEEERQEGGIEVRGRGEEQSALHVGYTPISFSWKSSPPDTRSRFRRKP